MFEGVDKRTIVEDKVTSAATTEPDSGISTYIQGSPSSRSNNLDMSSMRPDTEEEEGKSKFAFRNFFNLTLCVTFHISSVAVSLSISPSLSFIPTDSE